MNNVIYKYILVGRIGAQPVVMRRKARILSAAWQGKNLCIWALVDKDEPSTLRIIHVIPTGNGEYLTDTHELQFIDTVLYYIDARTFEVYHIFVEPENVPVEYGKA